MAQRRTRGTGDTSGQGQPGAGSAPQPSTTGEGELRSSTQVRTALIPGVTFHHKAVQYSLVEGQAILEGDIVLGTEAQVQATTDRLRAEATGLLAAGVVITGSQFRWPNCQIPYTIDPNLPNQQRVTDAIAHWQQNTQYRFSLRTNDADYVTFQPSSGCSSSVGRQGGQQFVNLGSGCTAGNAIHEIGHVVGLWHEQSRADRDTYVTIHWDKIQPGLQHNFDQHITDGDEIGSYDYGSIMHYPRNAFSIDGSDTITPTDPNAQIGQRTALSAGDIAAAASICSKPVKQSIKDIRKDVILDTRKELIKDLRLDTRKEQIADTRKELVLDTRPPILPVPGPLTPTLPGGLPFAVATEHQAPSATGSPADLETQATQLDAQLHALAEQLLQLDASRNALQAQYDQTAQILQQIMDAHDQTAG